MTDSIYLDNHATTPVDPRVVEVMWPWFAERVGNASSVHHAFGRAAADAVEQARAQVAAIIGASPTEVIFTSGATEANNLALKGVLAKGTKPHLITTAAEHRAVLDPASRLRRSGCRVTTVAVDEHAQVDPQAIEDAIRAYTQLASVIFANNEVGTLNPLGEIGALCREYGVLLHTDAAQAVGRVSVDVETLNVDLLSLSAHKLYGPQGIGALYVHKRNPPIRLTPQIDGGGHERRLRSGTLPVPLIVGFGEACRLAMQQRETDVVRISELRDRLQQRLVDTLDGLTVNGHPSERLPGNINISIDGVNGDALLAAMQGVAVSSGSACTSADPEPSHVLRAMGRSDALARASLRFGIGRFNTPEDVDRAAQIVIGTVRRLRGGTDR